MGARTDVQSGISWSIDIGRAVRGDALAPLFASGEILTFGANYFSTYQNSPKVDLMGLALAMNVPFPVKVSRSIGLISDPWNSEAP